MKSGRRWIDAPPDYGPRKTLYNRYVRRAARASGSTLPCAGQRRWSSRPGAHRLLRCEGAPLGLGRKTYGPPRPQEARISWSEQSAKTYPAFRQRRWPRWRSARSGPHKGGGVERHFTPEASRTPIDCQAIFLSPLADIISRRPPWLADPVQAAPAAVS